MLNEYGQQFIFKCNLNTKYTEKLKIHSILLKYILLAWSCVNFRNVITNIGKEIVRAPDYLFEKIVPQLKTCRFVYNTILEKKTHVQINQESKWEATLSTHLNWKNIFGQIINITIDTKLRSFQYKYIMPIVPNNEKLFKYGMIESSLFNFCSTSSESNIHLFGECPDVQLF